MKMFVEYTIEMFEEVICQNIDCLVSCRLFLLSACGVRP
jgi:hypothetical protein